LRASQKKLSVLKQYTYPMNAGAAYIYSLRTLEAYDTLKN
jgi:hypothetical protein